MKNYLKLGLTAIAVISIVVFSAFSPKAYSDDCRLLMRTQPYLQMPSANSMVVRWVTAFPCTGEVEYTTDPNFRNNVKKVTSTVITETQKLQLTGLNSNTTYYYRVRSILPACNGESAKEESAIYSFKTFNPSKTDFKVIVLNDLHTHSGQDRHAFYPLILKIFYETIGSIIDTIDYDLAVFNGDCLDDYSFEGDMIHWMDQLNRMVKNSSVPSVYLMGNHEYDGPLADTARTEESKLPFQNIALKKYLDFVDNGKTYGVININNSNQLLFLDMGQGVDSELKMDEKKKSYFDSLLGEQKTFLQNSIRPDTSKSRILFHHIPLFYNDEWRKSSENPYFQIGGEELNHSNVLLALSGHIHIPGTVNKHSFNTIMGDERYFNNYPAYTAAGPNASVKGQKYNGTVAVVSKEGSRLYLTTHNIDRDYQVHSTTYDLTDGIF